MKANHHHYCQASTFLPRPPPHLRCYPWRQLPFKPFSHSRISCSSNNFPRWDSNAETFRPRNFNFNDTKRGKSKQQQEEVEDDDDYGKKRRWWSDNDDDDDDDDDDDEFLGTEEGYGGVLDGVFDTVWIFKVLKSYGWALPIIMASLLFSTGPKAFLMALAFPLGQSALTLAFEKLWGPSETKPKRKYRARRKRRSPVNNMEVEEEQEENQKPNKGKAGMQSWVVEENGSADRGGRKTPSFGGWDDLERSRQATRTRKGSQRVPMEAGRLSRRERKSNTPLLLRLLIAVFPFLGTWTKML